MHNYNIAADMLKIKLKRHYKVQKYNCYSDRTNGGMNTALLRVGQP